MSLAEFYVVGYRQRRVLEVLTSGNYSRLCADILFSRQELTLYVSIRKGTVSKSGIFWVEIFERIGMNLVYLNI